MLKQVSLSMASVLVLAGCSSCATRPAPDMDTPLDADGSMSGYGYDEANILDGQLDENARSAASASVDAENALMILGEDTVQFGFDSAALDKRSQMILRGVAQRIKTEMPERVVVEGHCDERGTREYNLALGDRRAVAAKKFLVGQGIDPQIITTVSYGKERPLDPAHNASAWAKNRRSTVVFE